MSWSVRVSSCRRRSRSNHLGQSVSLHAEPRSHRRLALSWRRPPAQDARVNSRGQRRTTNPGSRSRLRHIDRWVRRRRCLPSPRRRRGSKGHATIRASLFMMTSTAEAMSEAEKCKVFRGANYLPEKLNRWSRFSDRCSITARTAILLIFLVSSFPSSLASRTIRAPTTRSRPFAREAHFAIATRLDTADRFFPTALCPPQLKAGISPGEEASRTGSLWAVFEALDAARLTRSGPLWPNAAAAQARRKVVERAISDADI
jgi:hypothetical protein